MSAENLLKKFSRNENENEKADPSEVFLNLPENVGSVRANSRPGTPASEVGSPGISTPTAIARPPSFFRPTPVPLAPVSYVKEAASLPKHRTPEALRRFTSRVLRESGYRGKTVNIPTLMNHPLYSLYTEYLEYPNKNILGKIKKTASNLGFTNPIVQTLQDIVEQQVENSTYDPNAKRNAALQSLVKVLGASTVSDGGKRRTRKSKKQRKARKTRKTRHSRK